jgi:colicin import membrane protein
MTPPRSDLRSPPPRGGAAGGPAKPDPLRPLGWADSAEDGARRRFRFLVVAACLAASLGLMGAGQAVAQAASAAPGQAAAATIADLAARRRAIDAQHAAELRACQSRFAVTACIDDAGQRRREALAPLREVELQLDGAERQQRAAQRRELIAAKQREAAARPPASAAPPLDPRWPAAELAAPGPLPRPPMLDMVPAEVRLRDAQAARRQQETQARRDRSLAAQARVAQRLRERADQGRVALPLAGEGRLVKRPPVARPPRPAAPASAGGAAR